ncbi:MAG: non-ribosomal peptide synthetase, partial [Lachnospiraceae bacterium]|nr:non-ribosomal peptide synthetase [Lachnospiraceae bacterium]
MLDRKKLDEVLKLSRGEMLTYDETLTWVDLFKRQVEKHPEKKAVCAKNGSLSYEELDRKSDALAAALVEKEGVKPDEFVAVHMDREKEFFIAALGIHKAGAAYLPIDLESPPGRIAYMMENSGARLTLTKKNVSRLCRLGKTDEKFVPKCTQDSYAYMIYTSGSTGEPKGVVIPHRALANFVHAIAHLWGLNGESRITLHSNFAFDASVEDIFPPLTVGGTVFVMPERVRKDIYEAREFIAKNHINGGCYSTQFGQLLAMDETPLDVDYFVVGGEAMTVVPNVRGRIINTYGPTEFTVDATYFTLEKGCAYKNIPIGRPLCNCAAYIVNEKLELLPAGETGEHCLAGPQLADGYWKRPELTDEKFTTLSLGGGESVKIYRTGDLAYWNSDGQLEFQGRIDTQVKLRGFRIELGEVERRAAMFPAMRQTAAEVRHDTLCLYYTATADVDEEELKAFMAQSLADFMVPQIFVRLEVMPETLNGKIDRKALPDPKHITKGEYVAPDSEEERVTEEIVRRILGSEEPISVTDDFFEMGGDSIKAIRVVSDLRKLGYLISVAEVMHGRTVRGIASLLHTTE